jgi:SnoaL-like domain
MDHDRVDAWLERYRRAWEQADTPAVLGLFTADATYRSHPLHPAHTGHQGIADYWTRATAVQREVRVRFGHPIVDGDRVAAEWWTVMRADGTPVTLGNPGGGDPARGHARRWAEGYEAAWRAGDPEAAAALYAPDAHYRSEPFRAPHLGREGVLTYTRDAYATEADQDPRFGAPFASGASAAVEWWTTTLEEGQPATLIGTSFLTFTPDGLVATGRDYWFLEPGFHPPHDEWGR